MSAYLDIGLPHHGKSFMLARSVKKLLWRNYKWHKRGNEIRLIYSNLVVSEKYLLRFPKLREFLKYWQDPRDLVGLRDVDIVWDEIARHLDSRDWKELDPDLKILLQEHDKLGIDIFSNTQTPMQVDVMFRRNCEGMHRITKLFGSRRPTPTKPPIRFIWGLLMIRKLQRESFSKEESEEEYENELLSIPHFYWLGREICEFFDTRQQIPRGEYKPYRHILRKCEDKYCNFERVVHS